MTRTLLYVTVDGKPIPQGSKRPFIAGGRARVREQLSDTLAVYRGDVAEAARRHLGPDHEPHEGAVTVALWFRFSRPKVHYRTGRNAHLLRDNAPPYWQYTKTPDIDKLQRSVLDALTHGRVFKDDSQVVGVSATKVWVPISEPSSTTIAVTAVTEDPTL